MIKPFIILIVISMLLFSGFLLLDGVIYQTFTSVPGAPDITNRNFLVIAHRGASAEAPENTLAAFKKAAEAGVDVIELDVHLSADGVPVVIHDARADRTTSLKGLVSSFTAEELSAADAGSWFGQAFAGEPVPSLATVLQQVKGHHKWLVELKNDSEGNLYPLLSQKVAEVLAETGHTRQAMVQAFDSRYLYQLHDLDTGLQLQKLVVAEWPVAGVYFDTSFKAGSLEKEPFFMAVNPFYRSLTRSKIERAHRRGVKVFPYTVNIERDMRKLLAMGVDGIITNYPATLLKLRNEINRQGQSR